MGVVRSQQRELKAGRFEGIRSRVILDQEAMSGAVTLGELILAGGASLPKHKHIVEEAFFIFEGRGKALLGDEVLEVTAGDAVLAPAGVYHGFRNDSGADLKMAFFYPAVSPWTEFE